MSKQKHYQQALTLRKSGYSYSYIREKVPVSKSTLSVWLSGVPYSPNKYSQDKVSGAVLAMIHSKQLMRQKAESIAQKTAAVDIGKLSARDVFMLGLGIYIGEGTKSNNIRVSGSDPRIIAFTIKWLKETCGLKNENFKLRLHLYPDNNISESIAYWSKELGLTKNQFYKTQIDKRRNKIRVREGKLPYGTAHLSVISRGKKEFGVVLARRIQAWISLVLNKRV